MTHDLSNWKKSLIEDLGEDNVSFGGANLGRFSSGIYSVDRALGGGWPYGLFSLVVGYESSGKSTLVTKSAAEMNKINRDTGKLDLSFSNPSGVLYADQEGCLDTFWAKQNGFDTEKSYNEVVQLSDGQKMVDVVVHAMLSGEFGLIIVDSLESTMSMKVLEQSAEDAYMGDRARILNDGYRRWISTRVKIVAKHRDTPWKVPTLIAINQLREKIGVMHGDPSVIPGGIGQRQNSSIIIRMYSPKVESDGNKTYGMGTFKGITQKNKTFSPKRNFSFDMAITDTDLFKLGEVDNAGGVFQEAKTLGMLFKDEKGWRFGDEEFRIQGEFKDKLRNDPEYLAAVWKKLLQGAKDDSVE